MYGNHFNFQELIHTDTSLDNNPVIGAHLANLACLWDTLNNLRKELGAPIYVNSAYRTPQVNKQIGGAERSLHMQGRAADIRTKPEHMAELWRILQKQKHKFYELINYGTFYHISQ